LGRGYVRPAERAFLLRQSSTAALRVMSSGLAARALESATGRSATDHSATGPSATGHRTITPPAQFIGHRRSSVTPNKFWTSHLSLKSLSSVGTILHITFRHGTFSLRLEQWRRAIRPSASCHTRGTMSMWTFSIRLTACTTFFPYATLRNALRVPMHGQRKQPPLLLEPNIFFKGCI
jgi:hypothetical protein